MSTIDTRHILVVGGAGYIGSHVAYHLACLGYTVTILDCLRYGQSPRALRAWARVVVGDYGDRVLLDVLFKQYHFSAVVHCGALIEVAESMRDPDSYYATNVCKTQVLLDAMRTAGITTMIYSSSCAVYGTPARVPITEDTAFAPLSTYGRTKVVVEYLLHDYAYAYDFNYISLRYFNAAGAQPEVGIGESHEPETHLIPRVLRALHMGEPVTIFGSGYDTADGTPVRDYVHVRDIAHAHHRALIHLQETGVSNVFNLGTGHGYSVKQVVAAAEKALGVEAQVVIKPRRDGDPATLIADARKAQQFLGWQPEHSTLSFIMSSALRWEQQNQFFQ